MRWMFNISPEQQSCSMTWNIFPLLTSTQFRRRSNKFLSPQMLAIVWQSQDPSLLTLHISFINFSCDLADRNMIWLAQSRKNSEYFIWNERNINWRKLPIISSNHLINCKWQSKNTFFYDLLIMGNFLSWLLENEELALSYFTILWDS